MPNQNKNQVKTRTDDYIIGGDSVMKIYGAKNSIAANDDPSAAIAALDAHNNTDSNLKIAPAIPKPKISILGMGYVGAVSAACFSEIGHHVIGVDPDPGKVDSINNGVSPIVEDGLEDLLTKAHNRNLLSATLDAISAVQNTDITLISVGTPSDKQGACDLRYLTQATTQVGQALKFKNNYHLVIYRSTIPPRTTRDKLIPLLEKASGKRSGKDFGVCFNPEFLRESTAIKDFYDPPKTVIGAIDKRSADYAEKLYQDVSGELIKTSLEAAEFVKYVDNTWHAMKVSFANEVGRLCKAMDVDSHDVMNIFVKDKKLNLSPYYLKPGFAYGGSCLPKDTRGISNLADTMKVDLPLINSLTMTNNRHIGHAVELIRNHKPKVVGIVGITFKPDTDDLRESPSLKLAKMLNVLGYELRFYDPNISLKKLKQELPHSDQALADGYCETPTDLIESSDLVVIAHQHAYAELITFKAKAEKPVIDLVRLSDNVRGGENYEGICW